jgi:transposase InsO family protein
MGDAAGMLEVLALLLAAVLAALRTRRDLVVENALLRHQLAVLTRPTRKRPRMRTRDRLLWVVARRLCRDWRRHLVLVRPATVVGWHRRGWRLFWCWRSRCPLGRPRVSAQVRELIATMARANPLWGAERIRGGLLKLGIAVSNRSIRRYRGRAHRPPGQTWRTFLRNHAAAIWAAGLFTVQTLTFRTLYVLLFISHGRRELVHLAVTAHPTAAWIWRQVIEATPWGRQPRYLVRDRDRAYVGDFVSRAQWLGITSLLTPVRAPRANAIAERVVRTLRNECLDHVIVVNEAHLRALLGEFLAYYNAERPHRAVQLEPPVPPNRSAPPGPTRIRRRPVLGGLHNVYERVA